MFTLRQMPGVTVTEPSSLALFGGAGVMLWLNAWTRRRKALKVQARAEGKFS